MHGSRLVADRYRLDVPLGEGGMGVVWRARDEVLGRDVAVKEVRAPAGLGTAEIRRLYARLEREARAAGRITHRNAVTVYDVVFDRGGTGAPSSTGAPSGAENRGSSGGGDDGERPWIVMELVRGLSLAEVLAAEGPLTPQRAALIGADVLAALMAAHDAGVLHRDVKPGNVLIGNDGRVVLSDFGIATLEGTPQLTMTGELVGSPEFLAPERALGRTPGPESDLWSLGVLLYTAVEGGSPFRRDTALNTLRSVVEDELPPPRRAGELAPVLAGLLRKDPAERPAAAEAARALRVVGAGGAAPRTAPSGPYAPTVTTATPVRGPVPVPVASPVPAPAGSAAAATAPVPQSGGDGPGPARRSPAVLAAGAALAVVAAAGLAWALVDGLKGDGGGDGRSGGTSTSAARTAGSPGPPGSPGTAAAPGGTGATEQSTTGGTSPSRETRQTVTVTVEAVRNHWSGSCPPPDSGAPAFRARITVGRTPAVVEYRWATESGTAGDDRWRTLSFGRDGARQRTAEFTVSAYRDGETLRDRIRVEVRNPVVARSEWAAFTVSCERTPPSSPDGSSASTAADGAGGDTGGR
ncbi:serine/threonine-protein kinase [Streptomyces tsukubensis]|uniref:non-specific serine/threonine protein kinase n=2 Tax=Streptomyces TaxID=1883 RepID=A0A7G3UNR2_STRT9|nr:serine/threonine-protein kinase [Streptomyces tsukubensis]QKM70492.1 serine/threonine protein kinase [Streptomyces tsukubensis NRRL18488]TAI40504.1 serine/threonine protein kinase [Streptomyces tsukubensis]